MRPRSPALLHYNGLGDRLLALPAVRAVAALYPSRLTVVGGPGDGALFYAGLPLKQVHEVEFRPLSREAGSDFDASRVAAALGGTDLFLSLNTWHNPAVDEVLARLGGVPTLGFDSRFATPLAAPAGRHAFEVYFAAARHLDPALRLTDFSVPPRVAPEPAAVARQVRARLPEGTRLLCLHTETAPAKMWSPDGFRQVLDAFLARHPRYFAVVVDVADFGLDRIAHGDRVLALSGLYAPFAMAIVQTADLFLGVDSCMLHLADLARVPSVGLFGPTDPGRWGLRFTRHRHVVGGDGMARLAAAEVVESLAALAAEAEERPPRR